MSLECEMFDSIYEQVSLKCPFFHWIDNPTCMRENEVAYLVQQKLDLLRGKLQLANERERTATQITLEATQMVEIAQERATKATERERKFRTSSVKANEIAVRALEQERKCRIALFCHGLFLFWLCCFPVLVQVRILE